MFVENFVEKYNNIILMVKTKPFMLRRNLYDCCTELAHGAEYFRTILDSILLMSKVQKIPNKISKISNTRAHHLKYRGCPSIAKAMNVNNNSNSNNNIKLNYSNMKNVFIWLHLSENS